MVLDGILRYIPFLKLLVWYLRYQQFKLLSRSVTEISAKEDTLVESFLFSTMRVSAHKNGRISNTLPTDISATEKLSITKYY